MHMSKFANEQFAYMTAAPPAGQESVDKLRDVFKRKLEAYAREVAELTRIVGLMQARGV